MNLATVIHNIEQDVVTSPIAQQLAAKGNALLAEIVAAKFGIPDAITLSAITKAEGALEAAILHLGQTPVTVTSPAVPVGTLPAATPPLTATPS